MRLSFLRFSFIVIKSERYGYLLSFQKGKSSYHRYHKPYTINTFHFPMYLSQDHLFV